MTRTPAAPDRQILRRLAVAFVLVFAGLATAGTSSSPQPPPVATAQASGILEVTAAQPIASVVVSMEANETARSIVGSHLATRIGAGMAANGAAADPAGPTVVVLEPLDQPAGHASTGTTASLTGTLADSCPEFQNCAGRYRITAILIDPAVATASVAWGASLELRMDGPSRLSAAPADARLTVRADEPLTRAAAELALATLPAETVHLDADHPSARRLIEIERPARESGLGADGGWLALLTIADPAGRTGARPPFVRLDRPGHPAPAADGGLGRAPIYVLPACPGVGGCTTPLRLDLGMPGGALEDDRDVTWSIVVFGLGPAGAKPPGPVGVRVSEAFDVGPTSPRLEASMTGSFDVQKGSNGTAHVTIGLDASRVLQGARPIDGVLQVRYAVRTTAASGAGRLNLGVGMYQEEGAVPITYGQVEPGAAATLVTQVEEMACPGRSTCTLFAPVFAIAPDAGPAVRVEWTLTAIWFPANGAAAPDDLELRIGLSPESPAP